MYWNRLKLLKLAVDGSTSIFSLVSNPSKLNVTLITLFANADINLYLLDVLTYKLSEADSAVSSKSLSTYDFTNSLIPV